MFENIVKFFKKLIKTENKGTPSKDTAKERLHLVLMQDRANVSADFLELMKQEIIEVIKKYIDVEESAIDVRLTNEIGEDGSKGAPSLYANIPIKNIKNGIKNEENSSNTNNDKPKEDNKKEDKKSGEDEENKEEAQQLDNKEEIKNDNQEQKEAYLNGRSNLFDYFVGQVMKETRGKANPVKTKELLSELLK